MRNLNLIIYDDLLYKSFWQGGQDDQYLLRDLKRAGALKVPWTYSFLAIRLVVGEQKESHRSLGTDWRN